MGNYNFLKDIVIGEDAERKALEILHKAGFEDAYKVNGNEKRWDIVVPSINKTFEIKNDLMSSKTGNLAIEIGKRSGEPSGITSSESDYFMIFTCGEVLLIDTPSLKEYVNNGSHRVVNGGDKWQTRMALVKISDMKEQNFTRKIK